MGGQIENLVDHASKLIAIYGYWPSFHDAAVEEVRIQREGPTVTVVFRYTDLVLVDGETNKTRRSYITVRWDEVQALTFSGIDPDENNWIDRLEFSQEEDAIRTQFVRMDGVHGFVIAKRVTVLDVRDQDITPSG